MPEYQCIQDCVLSTESGPDHVLAGETRFLDKPCKHFIRIDGEEEQEQPEPRRRGRPPKEDS
jgi:hypothetical protein